MSKPVILLNGPSSSGKSTLAVALQALLSQQQKAVYARTSIDDFLAMAPDRTIYENDVFAISATLCAKAKELLQQAPGLIIDHVITSERIFRQLQEALCAYDCCLIRVSCPLAELERREQARGNRCPGSALASEQYLYPQTGYDGVVDTFACSAAQCAQQIAAILAQKMAGTCSSL